jgi:hypothetical protein
MARTSAVLATALLIAGAFAHPAFAQMPRTLSYQGALTDQSGTPVADGSYSITFRLYTAASGGSAIWSETQALPVSGGILSAVLGSVTPLADVPFSQPYWLSIQVSPGSELAPRVPLTSVGYSLRAAVADAAQGFSVPMSLSGATSESDYLLSLTNTSTGRGLSSTVTSTGFLSAGVRGENLGTGPSGVGVWGSQQGSGYGVYGTSVSGAGLFGSGGTYGVYGQSYSNIGRGVFGYVVAPSGTTYGVLGSSESTGGRGVYGLASATTGNTYGVHGRSESSGGRGIVGQAPSASGSTIGVYGVVTSPAGRGVYGYAAATTGSPYGVHGRTDSPSGRGVFGHAVASSGDSGIGVEGRSDAVSGRGVAGISANGTGVAGTSTNGIGVSGFSTDGYGVHARALRISPPFSSWALLADNPAMGTSVRLGGLWAASVTGTVGISGDLYSSTLYVSSSKNFKIDHPLDPLNRYLLHAAIESPEVLNFYNGNVTTDAGGLAVVRLPDYFEALNIDYRYQLTVVGEFAQAIVSREIENNSFEIRTDRPNVRVSWQVTGVRNDPYIRANPMMVERNKETGERGRYLHPEVYGAPREQGIHHFPLYRPEIDLLESSFDEGLSDLETDHARLAEELIHLEAESSAVREELHRLEAERRGLEDK